VDGREIVALFTGATNSMNKLPILSVGREARVMQHQSITPKESSATSEDLIQFIIGPRDGGYFALIDLIQFLIGPRDGGCFLLTLQI
jgi:hypothetical protein